MYFLSIRTLILISEVEIANILLQLKLQHQLVVLENLEREISSEVLNNLQDSPSILGDIVKHVKKEYKKITGNALTLSPIKDEEANILVQSTSNVRVFVVATKKYKIGNLDGVEEIAQPSDENRLDDSFKKFLDQGGFDGKKASNVTRKDVKDPKERILDQIPATTGYAS